MSDILCQGWHVARDAGLIQDGAVVRMALALSTISIDPDDINVDDTNLSTAEYNGTGYSQHVAENVTWQYSTADDEMQLDCDDVSDAFGTTVGASTPAPAGVVFILQVGGSPSDSADYILGYQDSGSYGNGNGGALGVTVPSGGFMFSGQA